MEMKRLLRANWDRALAVGLLVLGALALLVGWIGTSGTAIAAEQNPYIISGGLGGIALIIVGCTVWLSADLQDEWRQLDALEAPPGEPQDVIDESSAPAETAPEAERRPTRRRARAGAPV